MRTPTGFISGIRAKCEQIVSRLKSDETIGDYVDGLLPCPEPCAGDGDIRLLVIGQDPTVDAAASRARIDKVLDLGNAGNLKRYIEGLCSKLDLDLASQVYATNVCKNFFTQRPETIADPDLIVAAWPFWESLLIEELAQFPDAIVVTLGEPVLRVLVQDGYPRKVKHFWGHQDDWKNKGHLPFSCVTVEQSAVGRSFFPLPHQTTSQGQEFYRQHLDEYMAYVRSQMEREAA